MDETKARGLLLAAAMISTADLSDGRQAIRRLILPNQRRIHFAKEQDGRRKQILDVLDELAPEVIVYDGSRLRPHEQRTTCLQVLMADMCTAGVQRLVLETDESVLDLDRRVLYQQKRTRQSNVHFEHQRTREEPLLAIPDAVAWCWQRGGAWRKRVRSLVVDVREV